MRLEPSFQQIKLLPSLSTDHHKDWNAFLWNALFTCFIKLSLAAANSRRLTSLTQRLRFGIDYISKINDIVGRKKDSTYGAVRWISFGWEKPWVACQLHRIWFPALEKRRLHISAKWKKCQVMASAHWNCKSIARLLTCKHRILNDHGSSNIWDRTGS